MSVAVETFFGNLRRLTKKLGAHRALQLSGEYPEAQAKIDFITRFFKALGWDVENEAGLSHEERAVRWIRAPAE